MSLTSAQRRKLLKFIGELGKHKGRHTELVSVYIPAGYDLNKIINHLAQEQGTASNIKDATTRKNVIDSLERMIQHLRLYKKTPPHGLAVFSGNTAEREGQQDIEVFSIEPPEPLNFRLYRCDKTFMLDALREQADKKETYGLVVMDRRDAHIALLKGKSIVPLAKTSSNVPGKTRAGGQCCIPSTLIQSVSGDIIEIKKSHNPIKLCGCMLKDFSLQESPITDKWDTEKDTVYKIITKYPRIEIECSKDHIFFTRNEEIYEKAAEELKEGDLLLMAEKINIKGKKQLLSSLKHYNSFIIEPEGRRLLKEKREQQGLLQKSLAKKVKVTQTAISTIELGKRNVCRDLIKRLCTGLNIDFDNFLKKHTSPYLYQNIKLPTRIDEEFAQFLGYYMGDGSIEKDRITFFEQAKDLALKYKQRYDKYFNSGCSYRYRKEKNYHQLRFTSRPLVKLINAEFPEIKKAVTSEIPKKILESPDNIVAGFLRGFFDAEGYVNESRGIGLGINNKKIVQQIQMLFLRFGIIASMNSYNNRKNPYSDKIRYSINITEKKSLQLYKQNIGFTSKKKMEKLQITIKSKSGKSNVRQLAVSGRKIRKIIEEAGYNMQMFPKVTNFFRDERRMSKDIYFNSILKLVKEKNTNLYNKLKVYYNSPILSVKIDKIKAYKRRTRMVDISTKTGNFIAHGLIVHNSSQRFERLREGAAKEFYKKIAEYMKSNFLDMKELKGIIVGGPGQTKYELVNGGFITDQVCKKIIAVKDLSYTGEFGLQELVDKSKDVLADEEISKEKAIMQKFFEELATNPSKVSYGMNEVKKCLEMGAVDTLILSEVLDDNIIEEFEKNAENFGTKVEIVSTETREGVQLRDMGRIAALLRYEVE
ncbi:helix-turn-helix domain-containing protein [Candidatus Woesearchaeota archaeon]|nr:helix-turn-helix domain-containing protein [Candidatus Woesearchaeota archaeon]